MKLKNIAFCSLKRRKAKGAFVLVGLLIGISAVVVFISLVNALTQDFNEKLEKYGANILIVPETENLSLSYGGLSLGGISFEMREIRQENLEKLRYIKNAANIAAVGPMVLGVVHVTNLSVLVAGVDFGVSRFLRPWWNINGSAPDENGALIGSEAARVLNLRLGQTFTVNQRELTVRGVLGPTGSQDDNIMFVSLGTAQSLLKKEEKISMAEVAALCAGCPIEEMVRQISEVLPDARVMGIKQVVKGRMETLEHFQRFGYGASALVMLVGGLVVLVTMMGNVRERTAEFGIFRAIGFRRGHVMNIVLLEAAIISAIAGIAGYLVGLGATKVSIPLFTESSSVAVPFDPILAGGVLALALILGLTSSAYPALLAARLDPCTALKSL